MKRGGKGCDAARVFLSFLSFLFSIEKATKKISSSSSFFPSPLLPHRDRVERVVDHGLGQRQQQGQGPSEDRHEGQGGGHAGELGVGEGGRGVAQEEARIRKFEG